jgi:hypothetical protein
MAGIKIYEHIHTEATSEFNGGALFCYRNILSLPLPLPLPLLATRHHHNHGRSVASSSSSTSSSYRHWHCRHHRLPPPSVMYLIVMLSCPLPSIVMHSSSFFMHFITISPLVPPSFVDCCFKRWTKPLLPMMVSLLSSRPSALVICFRCPPPPTLAASHGSRCQQSVALTAGALTSPLPCPPLVVATPPAVLPLCGVFRTLTA